MGGRTSRRKGAVGEREVRDVLRRFGFRAQRDGRLAADLDHDVPGWHLEVKRRETASVWAWLEQATRDALGRVPVVVFRRSRSPWYAVMPLDEALRLKRLEADMANAIDRMATGESFETSREEPQAYGPLVNEDERTCDNCGQPGDGWCCQS